MSKSWLENWQNLLFLKVKNSEAPKFLLWESPMGIPMGHSGKEIPVEEFFRDSVFSRDKVMYSVKIDKSH
jgi:hypothetical protein